VADTSLRGPHGGYRKLKAYQLAEIVYDGTVAFCKRAFPKNSRTAGQMIQAARSGKQNIAEGSEFSGTSKKTEMKLTGVARASLEELKQDYQDFLRQNKLEQWSKNNPKADFIRRISSTTDRSYETYRQYIEEKSLETAANTLLTLVFQAGFLLDQLLEKLEQDFLEQGGFTEKLYSERVKARSKRLRGPD
jgi:restriction system protein